MSRTLIVGAGAGALYGVMSHVPLPLFIVMNQPTLSGVLIALVIGVGVALVGAVLGGTYGLVAGAAGGLTAARSVNAGGSSRRAQVWGAIAVAAAFLLAGAVFMALVEDLETMIGLGLWLVGVPGVLATIATYMVIGRVLGDATPTSGGGTAVGVSSAPPGSDSAATSEQGVES